MNKAAKKVECLDISFSIVKSHFMRADPSRYARLCAALNPVELCFATPFGPACFLASIKPCLTWSASELSMILQHYTRLQVLDIPFLRFGYKDGDFLVFLAHIAELPIRRSYFAGREI